MLNYTLQIFYGLSLVKVIFTKQLLTIKKEKEGLEKQATKFKIQLNYCRILFLIIFLNVNLICTAQTDSYIAGKEYIIDSISVKGLKSYNDQTVISYSGLTIGQKPKISTLDRSNRYR